MVNEPMAAGGTTRPASVKVWDPFVRVFHWSLVSLFLIAWATPEGWDRLHEYAGYAIAVAIGLRLVWGLIGTRHARFSDFVYRPSAVIAYLKDSLSTKARRYLGHNPAGGAMILALLISLSLAIATGVMSTMDAYWGLKWVGNLHEFSASLTIGLILVHIAGVILTSLRHRENLVRSMFSGTKRRED